MKITVITPTIRKEGLALVDKALNNQTFTDFEWLIGSKFEPKDFTRASWIEDKHEGGIWTLNRCYNDLIKNSKGELIVSWQDFTWSDKYALEKFWYAYECEPRTLVSGVGNKYEDESWTQKNWQDPRERSDQGTFYGCDFADIEYNFCAVPKIAFYEIGGFDEGADFEYFGMDGYGVNERLWTLGGWDFKLHQGIKSYSLGHGRPQGWEEKNGVHGPYTGRKKKLFEQGLWPKMNYLDNL